MHSEYHVLHKQDSYTSHVWLLGWLGLAMEVQGSMPKVELMCTSKDLAMWYHLGPSGKLTPFHLTPYISSMYS